MKRISAENFIGAVSPMRGGSERLIPRMMTSVSPGGSSPSAKRLIWHLRSGLAHLFSPFFFWVLWAP